MRDIAGPAELAAHLTALATDRRRAAEYRALLAWKQRPWRAAFEHRFAPLWRSPWRRLADAQARHRAGTTATAPEASTCSSNHHSHPSHPSQPRNSPRR